MSRAPVSGWLLAVLVSGALLAVRPAGAAAASAPETPEAASGVLGERQRIEQQRAAVEAESRARELDCAGRFVVTACVEEVRTYRHQALDALRLSELQLDDAERQRRAADRAASIERKRIDAAARPPAAPIPPLPASSRPPGTPPAAARSAGQAGAAPTSTPLKAQAPASAPARVSNQALEAAQAASRAAASAQRREAADLHRAEVERRNAERAASGKIAAPLPLPAPLPPSTPQPRPAVGP
jgi:hypothetical protein